MLKKRKLCGGMQNWDPLLQFNDSSVQSTTETLLMTRESRSGKQHFLRQDLSLRGMVVVEHEHQRKMFSALQMHLQEALGNPFVRCHVSFLSQNPQSTMCFTSVLSFVHTNYNFYMRWNRTTNQTCIICRRHSSAHQSRQQLLSQGSSFRWGNISPKQYGQQTTCEFGVLNILERSGSISATVPRSTCGVD
jgi:hypothetical protein